MKFWKPHSLFLLLAGGFFLRLLLLYLDFSFDVNNHIVWGQDIFRHGFQGFYDTPSSQAFGTAYPNYPPIAIYIFSATQYVSNILHAFLWQINVAVPLFPSKIMAFADTRIFVAGMYKLPAICFDIATSYLLFMFAKRIYPKKKSAPFIVVTLVLFNPVVFYNSAYWGQIDIIPIFFAVLSIYILIYSKKYYLSALFFIIGILIKPTILLYAPVYSLFFLKQYGVQNAVKALFLSVVFYYAAFLPFYSKGNFLLYPLITYTTKIMDTQSLQYVTNGAYNFWNLVAGVSGIRDSAVFLASASYRLWGYILWIGLSVFVMLKFHIKNDRVHAFFMSLFLVSFAGFLFLTKMHERYLLLSLIPLTLLVPSSRMMVFGFTYVTIVGFLNLYHSWAVPHSPLLYAVTDNRLFMQSISLVNIVLCIFYYQLKFIDAKNRNLLLIALIYFVVLYF